MALVRANVVDLCTKHGVDASPAFADMGFVLQHLKGLSDATLFEFGGAEEEWKRLNPDTLVEPLQAMRAFQPNAVLCAATPRAIQLGVEYEDAEGAPAVLVACAGIGPCILFTGAISARQPARPTFFPTSKFLDDCEIIGVRTGWHQSGAWLHAEEPTIEELVEEPLASLAAFLAEGPRPVAFGWGSMMAKGVPPVAMLVRALLAVQEVGQRAVVLGGWAKLDDIGRALAGGGGEALLQELVEEPPTVDSPDGLDDVREALRDEERRESLQDFARTQCCFVASAPHAWLFARCCCVVHHGGAGTTHACLHAGKPCVITPVAFDQWHWAGTVEKLGVGRSVGGEAGLRAARAGPLAAAIRGASELEHAAEALGAKMRAEPGVAEAAEVLYEFLSKETRHGRWHCLWRVHHGA